MSSLLRASLVAAVAALAPLPALAGGTGLEVSESSLSFSRFGERRAVTVTNRGPETVRILRGSIATQTTLPISGFALDLHGGALIRPVTLEPGKSMTLNVEFRPLSGEPRRQYFAALKLSVDDPTKAPELTMDPRKPPPWYVVTVPLRGGVIPPLLSMMIALPLLGALAALVLRRRRAAGWAVALGAAAASAVLALVALALFDPTLGPNDVDAGLQLAEHFGLVHSLGIEYRLGASGLSIALVVLTGVLGLVALALSHADAVARGPRVPALLLVCQAALTGAFAAQNLALLAAFWFVALAAAVCLLGCGTTGRSRVAVWKLALASAASLTLLVLATIQIGRGVPPTYGVDGLPLFHSLDLVRLSQAGFLKLAGMAWGLSQADVVWVMLVVAFGMFLPLVPLHGWLRDAMLSAPPGGAVLVGGVLARFGIFGLLHVAWRVLPQPTRWGAATLAVIAVLSMAYGALAALTQRTLRGLAACSTIVAGGMALLGACALTQSGVAGAALLTWGHGVAVALLVVTAWGLEARGRSARLEDLAGSAPRLAAVAAVACVAGAALPGSAGFGGQMLAVAGAFPAFRALSCTAALITVVAAAAHVRPLANLFRPTEGSGPDLERHELALAAPLAAVVILIGVYPRPVLGALAAAAHALLGPNLPAGSAGLMASLFR